MIVDAKLARGVNKLVVIDTDSGPRELDTIEPYFYVIVSRSKAELVARLIEAEDVRVEETDYRPVIFKGSKYDVDSSHVVLRVVCASPRQVPRLAEFARSLGARVAAHNVRYVIRNVFDLDVRFFNAIPLFYAFDSAIIDKLARVEILVIDIEAVDGKPVLASVYRHRLFDEVRRDDVEAIRLPEERDRLQALLLKASVIAGHNIVGFDLPMLRRIGVVVDSDNHSIVDSSVILTTHGSSLGVGAARSLLDVSIVLKEEAGITDDEIDVKKKVGGRVDKLSWEDLVKYNVNDVVLTAKLLNVIYGFIAVISALAQIPPSEAMSLPAGMIAEYFLLRLMELQGFIPEYRPTGAHLSAERVLLAAERVSYQGVLEVDIDAMYPNFVLNNYVDPTLHIGGRRFHRMAGHGFLYSAVKRLMTLRYTTKALKKRDKRFEPVDKGVKAIVNALAYGVQGKASGYAVMGNPWCPEKIFYGTYEIQRKLYEYAASRKYRPVYSDTDSLYVVVPRERAEEVAEDLNKFLAGFGLRAKVEGYFDYMYVYAKKNYILRSGDVVILKGSALRNLVKFYLPEAISVPELLKLEPRERLKYIKEVVEAAPLEELFPRCSQMLWRFIGKDVQSWKRLGERRERYLVVLTPWPELSTLVLKRVHPGHVAKEDGAPFVQLLVERGGYLELEDENPFMIYEARGYRVRGRIRHLSNLLGSPDMLLYSDGFTAVWVKELRYVLRIGGSTVRIPSQYDATVIRSRNVEIIGVEAVVRHKRVSIGEDVFRRIIYSYVVEKLREYGLLGLST